MITKKALLLSLIPIIIVGVYLFRFGVNVPFWDQWEVVPLLMKKYAGALSASDLFAQHNEHRPFFPRLIWITLAGFTHYNVNVELWANFVIALGTFCFFVNRAIKTWNKMGMSTSPLLIPLMSLLVFNLGQRDSWLQGYQLVMYLGVAGVVIGLFLLAEDSSRGGFFAAVILGIVTTYSMADGLIYWFVGLAVLAITASNKWKVLKFLLWIVVGTLSIGLFLHGWAPWTPVDPTYPISHPIESYFWILNFLGAPVMTLWPLAWIFGTTSIGLYLLVAESIEGTNQWRQLIPYFAIALYILLASFSICVGRMTMGVEQSSAPRYLTLSVWYWMSLLALLPQVQMKQIYKRVLYGILTTSLVVLTIYGGWRGYANFYQRMLPAYVAVHSGQTVSDSVLARIFPYPDMARPWLQFLCDHKLSACTGGG